MIGGGGHARVLVDALQAAGVEVLGILERDPTDWGTTVSGVPVLGGDDLAHTYPPGTVTLALAVAGFGDRPRRRAVYAAWRDRGYDWATIVHPGATVSPSAEIGEGAQVLAGAIVNPGAKVGPMAILNTGSIVEHDCVLGEGAHLAPGAVLGGGAHVGAWAQVGIHASVLHGRRVEAFAIVGAGAVVTCDVDEATVVTGVPARFVRRAEPDGTL